MSFIISEDNAKALVQDCLNIKRNLDSLLETSSGHVDIMRQSAHRFWSLAGTLNECIYSVSDCLREAKKQTKMHYAGIVNTTPGSEAARERTAKNGIEYITLSDTEDKYKQLLDYIMTIREDVMNGYYMCKAFHEVNANLMLRTPNTELGGER